MSRTDRRPHYGAKHRLGTQGYVYIWCPDHPLAQADGYVAEHRMVAWDAGLFSDSQLAVHHRNGDRTDNRLENLEPIDGSSHALRHAEERGTAANQYGIWKVKDRSARSTSRTPWPDHVCEECETVFTARADARYCSATCRLRSWKRRRREVLA